MNKGTCITPEARNDLVDPGDGENRAVRSFLMAYSCDRALNIDAMRKHMARSGWGGCWPNWVSVAHASNHLTKGGAQSWIRYLFALESSTSPDGKLT